VVATVPPCTAAAAAAGETNAAAGNSEKVVFRNASSIRDLRPKI
jgi:hypothetical protein